MGVVADAAATDGIADGPGGVGDVHAAIATEPRMASAEGRRE